MTLFEKIATELSDKIRSGVYSSGEELPTEVDLQKMYGGQQNHCSKSYRSIS